MILYQYIGVLIGLIGIIVTFLRFKSGKMSLNMLLVWSAVWILLIIFSVNPDTSSLLARATGIGRGLDLILIIGLIGCYYFIFKIYNMIENVEEEITHLVQEIALEKGQSPDLDKKNPPKDKDSETEGKV
jgi:hypothetical protein